MRSKAYPNIDLSTAVRRLELFNKSLGTVGSHQREGVAIAIGFKSLSGPASRAIAALVHYGLLNRTRDTYSMSALAQTIIFPTLPTDREEALKEAAITPALFSEITKEYQGKPLPDLLGNILISPKYGINPKVRDEVVEIFKNTITYAGILENGVIQPLNLDDVFSTEIDKAADVVPSTNSSNSTPRTAQKSIVSDVRLTRLPSGIEIAFPGSLDFEVLTGEFASEVKALELKAQSLLGKGFSEHKDEEID